MTTNPDLLRPEEILYGDERDDFQIMLGRMTIFSSPDPCVNGKWRLTYNFFFAGKLLFFGHEYLVPGEIAFNRRKLLSDILGWLSLKPGDTDEEFFDDYTVEQLAFVQRYGDDLFLWGEELEEDEGDHR